MEHIPELLFLALDCYRYPSPYDEKRSTGSPLPPGIGDLLAAQDNCLSDENIAATAEALAVTPEDCRAAVPLYLKLVLFDVPGDYYRVLGVEPDAGQMQIAEHHAWLSRLFDPARDVDGEGWDELYIPRIDEAYRVLGHPASRAAYDAELAGESGPIQVDMGEHLPRGDEGAEIVRGPLQSGAAPEATTNGDRTLLRQPLAYGIAGVVLLLAAGLYVFDRTSRVTVSSTMELQRPAVTRSFDVAKEVEYEAESEAETELEPQPEAGQDLEPETEREPAQQPQPVLAAEPVPEPRPELAAKPGADPEAEPPPEPESVSEPEPAAGLESELASVAPAAATAPVATPKAIKPRPAPKPVPITGAELEDLLLAFSYHYEFRDADAFANLFATYAVTPRARSRKYIRRYYAGVFANIKVHAVEFSNVYWQPGEEWRRGSATLSITTEPARGGESSTKEQQVKFEVGRGERGAIEITRMSY